MVLIVQEAPICLLLEGVHRFEGDRASVDSRRYVHMVNAAVLFTIISTKW